MILFLIIFIIVFIFSVKYLIDFYRDWIILSNNQDEYSRLLDKKMKLLKKIIKKEIKWLS